MISPMKLQIADCRMQNVTRGDGAALLVDPGFVEAEMSAYEVTRGVELQSACARKDQANGCGIGAGGKLQIEFQLSIVRVINQVYSGIEVGVLHLGEVGNVRAPARWIAAEEVVTLGGQRFLTRRLRSGSPEEFYSCLRGGHRTGSAEKHGVSASAGYKLHPWTGLAQVELKTGRRQGGPSLHGQQDSHHGLPHGPSVIVPCLIK